MKRLYLSNESPSRQLLITGLVVIACWIAFQLVSYITGIFIFGITLNNLTVILGDFTNPVTIAFLKYVQAWTSFGMFVFAAFLVARGINTDWMGFLTLDKKPGMFPLFMAGILIVVILPFTNLLTSINNELSLPEFLTSIEKFFRSKEDQMQQIMESFLNVQGMGGLLFNLLIIAVIPSIGEELIFRGIVQDRFSAWLKNDNWAIILTAIIFSALHIQFLSFLPRFFLGIVLGYLFLWSGSIWVTITAHFINNALAVIYYFLYYHERVDKTIELIGTPDNGLIFSIAGIISGGCLLYLIYRNSKRKSIF